MTNNEKMVLGEWTGYGLNNYIWNFYRSCDNFIIGFIVNDCNLFIKDPNLASWRLDTSIYSRGKYLCKLYIKIYGDKPISFKDLQTAKNNLDHIIEKYDSLKVFL